MSLVLKNSPGIKLIKRDIRERPIKDQISKYLEEVIGSGIGSDSC
jgi:hypothetical protein